MEQIIAILSDIRPDVDFEKEERLIDGGILESFDVISLVGELNDAYNISIGVQDLAPENFNSAESIYRLVKRLLEE